MDGLTKAAGDLALIDSAAHYGRTMSTLTAYNQEKNANISYVEENSSESEQSEDALRGPSKMTDQNVLHEEFEEIQK